MHFPAAAEAAQMDSPAVIKDLIPPPIRRYGRPWDFVRMRLMNPTPPTIYATHISRNALVNLTHGESFQASYADQIRPIKLRVGRQLGQGAEGRVFQVDVEDMTGRLGPQRLALKVVQVTSQQSSDDLWSRVELWKHLDYPGVSPLVAVVDLGRDAGLFGMMSPWASRGTLADIRLVEIEQAERLSMLKRIAEGVNYLHTEAGVVHGDLKAENILVMEDGSPVITDYGLSTYVAHQENRTRTDMRVKHTTRFASPELLEDAAYGPLPSEPPRSKTTHSDIYAFGGLIYQMHTGHAPWRDKSESGVITAVISGQLPQRPEPGDGAPFSDEMWNLCLRCWNRDPRQRPTSGQLVQILDNMSVA